MSILLADPTTEWTDKIAQFLISKGQNVDRCINGKECQLRIFKNSYDVLIIDFHLKNHSALEVLRYMSLNHSKIKVILTFPDKNVFSELGLTKEELRKLGASDIFIKPFSMDALLKSIQGEKQFESWKELKGNESVKDEQELIAVDEEFTRVKVDSFRSGNITIFDIYIRLGRNKYVKILHKGDFFDEARLKKYSDQKHIEYLFFKTKDRGLYVNFINELLTKSILHNRGTSEQRLNSTKSVIEQYIEEVYTSGLNPQIIEEGKKICDNLYHLIQRDKEVLKIMHEFEEHDPPSFCHLFLTSFYSTVIAKSLDWSSKRTIEMTAFGGLLHDIGQLKLPYELRDKNPKDMSAKELAIYETHPLLGVQMLEKNILIPGPVKQIIYQHHELINGEGFPNRLSGSKIYPLAKVTSLANAFSELLVEKGIQPLQGIKEFITDRQIVMRYDSAALKGLVKSFIKDSK